jgi:hypothetical protein
MPHIFTNAEFHDVLYVYGFCSGSATAAADGEIFENVLYCVKYTNFVTKTVNIHITR